MVFKETPEPTLEGGLNVNVIVADESGRRYLKRYPKDNTQTIRLLQHEHDFLGFSQSGGHFRRRSGQEQNAFLQQAAQKGLKVLPPAHVDDRGFTYFRYIDGAQTLEDYLATAPGEEAARVVYELFADLRLAHSNGIVYGDRWSPNILVLPKDPGAPAVKTILHIDFDIEISGPFAREFELAETAYFTLCAGRQNVLNVLINILGIDVNTPQFNFKAFAGFMQRFSMLFKSSEKYGNFEKDVDALIAALRALSTVSQR